MIGMVVTPLSDEKSKKLQSLRNYAMMAMMAMSVAPAFAADTSGAFANFLTSIQNIFSVARPIVISICVLILCISAGIYALSKNERNAEAAFTWGKHAIMAAMVAAVAPWLIGAFIDLLGSGLTGTKITDISNKLDG